MYKKFNFCSKGVGVVNIFIHLVKIKVKSLLSFLSERFFYVKFKLNIEKKNILFHFM